MKLRASITAGPFFAEATSKEMAEQLLISNKTVECHRKNILDKRGMSDRVELTRYAIRRGPIQR